MDKKITLNGKSFVLDDVLANPAEFMQVANEVIPKQTLARRKKESEQDHVKRLFMRCLRKESRQTVDDAQPTEAPAEVKPITVTVSQTPNALATNTKNLAVDILVRLSDILMYNLYVTDPVQMPNDLLEAIKDLNDAAKALKAASEI